MAWSCITDDRESGLTIRTSVKDYGRFGVGEYWRFDPSGGEYHDAALAGDRLVDGRYGR